MSLKQALADAKKGRDYKRLAVDVLLAELDDEDQAALLEALHDTERTAPTLARVLTAQGVLTDINDPAQAVRSWRARNLA